MHLKASNGSKQSKHLCIALHAVAPNSLINSVFSDKHNGHATTLDGGAIPYFCNFSLVFSDIQSVVQAGE